MCAFGKPVAKNDAHVIRRRLPPICSLVRLSPSIGVMDGAHYRMSADILHPQKLQIFGDPITLAQRQRKGSKKVRLREEWLIVLQLMYGLEGYPIMTRKEEAKLIGVGAQYISRIRINAINTYKYCIFRQAEGRYDWLKMLIASFLKKSTQNRRNFFNFWYNISDELFFLVES